MRWGKVYRLVRTALFCLIVYLVLSSVLGGGGEVMSLGLL